MISVDEAVRLAMDLPGVTVGKWHGYRTCLVGRTGFAWERPFSKADVRRFGDAAVPTGPIFAARVADLRARDTVLAAGTRGVFTMAHFAGFPAVLIQLDVVTKRAFQQLIAEAWLACVPPSLADRHRVRSRKRRASQ